jgi:hypothetical protein
VTLALLPTDALRQYAGWADAGPNTRCHHRTLHPIGLCEAHLWLYRTDEEDE